MKMQNNPTSTNQSEKIETGLSASVYQSAVQKMIRRCEPKQAVKFGKLLFLKDQTKFWRRLTIIILEDCILHPALPGILEATLKFQSKKYIALITPTESLHFQNFGLSVIEQIAACRVSDLEYSEYRQPERLKQLPNLNRISELPPKEAVLVKAIYARKNLGGMRGDMEMLEIQARLWMKRFLNKTFMADELTKFFPKPRLNYEKITTTESIEEMPLEAIDFHVSPMLHILLAKPKIRDLLNYNWSDLTEDEMENKLKDTIWYLRSGLNFKEDLTSGKCWDTFAPNNLAEDERNKMVEVYNQIHNEIDNVSRWFLRHTFKPTPQ